MSRFTSYEHSFTQSAGIGEEDILQAIKSVQKRRSYWNIWGYTSTQWESADIPKLARRSIIDINQTLGKCIQGSPPGYTTDPSKEIRVMAAIKLAQLQIAQLEKIGGNRTTDQELAYIILNKILSQYPKVVKSDYEAWKNEGTNNEFLIHIEQHISQCVEHDRMALRESFAWVPAEEVCTDIILEIELAYTEWQASQSAVHIVEIKDDGTEGDTIPRLEEQAVIASPPTSQGDFFRSIRALPGKAITTFNGLPMPSKILVAGAVLIPAAAATVTALGLVSAGTVATTAATATANTTIAPAFFQSIGLAGAAYAASHTGPTQTFKPDYSIHGNFTARMQASYKPVFPALLDTSRAVTVSTAQPAPAPTCDIPTAIAIRTLDQGTSPANGFTPAHTDTVIAGKYAAQVDAKERADAMQVAIRPTAHVANVGTGLDTCPVEPTTRASIEAALAAQLAARIEEKQILAGTQVATTDGAPPSHAPLPTSPAPGSAVAIVPPSAGTSPAIGFTPAHTDTVVINTQIALDATQAEAKERTDAMQVVITPPVDATLSHAAQPACEIPGSAVAAVTSDDTAQSPANGFTPAHTDTVVINTQIARDATMRARSEQAASQVARPSAMHSNPLWTRQQQDRYRHQRLIAPPPTEGQQEEAEAPPVVPDTGNIARTTHQAEEQEAEAPAVVTGPEHVARTTRQIEEQEAAARAEAEARHAAEAKQQQASADEEDAADVLIAEDVDPNETDTVVAHTDDGQVCAPHQMNPLLPARQAGPVCLAKPPQAADQPPQSNTSSWGLAGAAAVATAAAGYGIFQRAISIRERNRLADEATRAEQDDESKPLEQDATPWWESYQEGKEAPDYFHVSIRGDLLKLVRNADGNDSTVLYNFTDALRRNGEEIPIDFVNNPEAKPGEGESYMSGHMELTRNRLTFKSKTTGKAQTDADFVLNGILQTAGLITASITDPEVLKTYTITVEAPTELLNATIAKHKDITACIKGAEHLKFVYKNTSTGKTLTEADVAKVKTLADKPLHSEATIKAAGTQTGKKMTTANANFNNCKNAIDATIKGALTKQATMFKATTAANRAASIAETGGQPPASAMTAPTA
ncbi:MAG: hypothetical protein P1U34_06625 [Coxiellaceae bacterium]|nr:hypothetical protein [Coxiellaceae bacterium]